MIAGEIKDNAQGYSQITGENYPELAQAQIIQGLKADVKDIKQLNKIASIMLIKVKVISGAGEDRLIKKDKDSFEIWVKEKPIQGQANRAVTRKLVQYFNKEVRLIKGGKQSNKIFKVIE